MMTATAQVNHNSQTIKTNNLASKHTSFYFMKIPHFVRNNERISSAAKYLYGELNFKAGDKGYIENWSREKLMSEVKFSLSVYKRAIAELIKDKLIFSLPCGNGKPNVYVMRVHPDMKLTPEEVSKYRITLPRRIQIRVDRAMKREAKRKAAEPSAGTNMSQQTPSAGTNPSQPMGLKIPFKDTFGLAYAGPSNIITFIVVNAQQPKAQSMSAGEASYQPTAVVPVPTPPQPTPAKNQKQKVRPRSKHSLELCLHFAHAEKRRKGTIEDAENFGQSCYSTGWHDKEIDRWLRKKAQAEVGKYRPTQDRSNQPTAANNGSEPSQESSNQPTPQPAANSKRESLPTLPTHYDPNCKEYCWRGLITDGLGSEVTYCKCSSGDPNTGNKNSQSSQPDNDHHPPNTINCG
jgi:hypothetical protein